MDSYLPIIFDMLLLAALAAAFVIGYKRGFLRTVWGLAAIVISIVLTMTIRPYTGDYFYSSPLCYMIEDRVYTTVYEYVLNETDSADGSTVSQPDESMIDASAGFFESAYSLPGRYAERTAESLDGATGVAASAAAEAAAYTAVSIAEVILLFIVIRLLLAIIHSILKLIFKFPVLKQTNKLLGGIVQTAIALTAVYAVFAVSAAAGSGTFDNTVLCRQLYEHNFLLTLLELW